MNDLWLNGKWKRVKNAVLFINRLLTINKEVQMYGTSEKLLDLKKRGFRSVKATMIPHH